MAKDPFPNEWDEVFNLDEDDIDTPAFIEVLSDIMAWELPDPYCAVIRIYNRKENKLREYAYRREGIAHQKIKAAAQAGYEVTILTNDVIGAINYPDDD